MGRGCPCPVGMTRSDWKSDAVMSRAKFKRELTVCICRPGPQGRLRQMTHSFEQETAMDRYYDGGYS